MTHKLLFRMPARAKPWPSGLITGCDAACRQADSRSQAQQGVDTMKACLSILATAVISLCFWGVPATQAQTTAQFELTFNATWSASTHPTAFPSSAHFSGMIGGTHLPERHYWQVGQNATPGIQAMAELGSQGPLRNEIRASGSAHHTTILGGVFFSPNTDRVTFTATRTHSALTLVSMIAPSPDWFVGVDALDLRPNGQWIDEHTVQLFAYDAGTDSGINFSSGNVVTRPAVPISAITGPPLGNTTPLGTFVIRRTSIQPDPPDLTVENVSVTDPTPEPGADFTINATVRNAGNGASAATTLSYYRSNNSIISTNDNELTTDAVGALASGASSPESALVSIPDEGTYWVGACVSTVDGENNIINNCSDGVQVTVTAPPVTAPTLPDLTVDNVSVSNASVETDANFTINATARNSGNGASAATTLHYYRSTDRTITTNDSQLATSLVSGLAPGGSSPESATVSIPDEGTYWVGACVSTVNGEINITNNCSDGVQVTVTAPPPVVTPPLPDLTVENVGVSDLTPEPGASFTVSATAWNRGDRASAATTLRYYLSTDRTITPGDTVLETDAVDGLASGASSPESATVSIPNEGTYWIGACVDTVDDETVAGNNCSGGLQVTVAEPPVPVPTQPDLLVDGVSVSTTTPVPDASFTVRATVRNRGDRAAPASTLHYYRSTDRGITRGDTELTTDPVVGLAPGGSSPENALVSIPDTGTYWIGVCVSTVPGETVIDNNCSDGLQVTGTDSPEPPVAPPTQPDLIVDDISVSDTTPEPGASFMINATVLNQGTAGFVSTRLRYYLSTDSTITPGDTELGTPSVVGRLAPDRSSEESASVSIPDAGDYWVGACVGTVIGEIVTANNCSTGVQVSVTAILPDLTVENVSVSDSTPEPGIAFTINATAWNRGNGASAATTLSYYLSEDATISADDTELETDAVDGLAAGGSSPQSASVSIPDEGTYWIGACIDTASDEVATANNCSTGVQVSVTAPSPDLTVENVGVSNLTPEAGASFTISATAWNRGNEASSVATTLRYYLSDDETITTDDTELTTDTIGALATDGSAPQSAEVSITDAGIYWIGACIDPVSDEVAADNNCSTGVSVSVTVPPNNVGGALPAILRLLLLP